ncbi:class I poly(R)-hydroxyalkanoic acid synthase [Niveibacterium sp. 24ML]|uniref:PHA/PHB synthase family protein n=1 Tax=Niveibacterium sp. 24ML TaxID=2985512 RepID=UPI00226DCD83|nr:class I poly(R)-hydroxyalkanoic acid synthase [Niveibacterium sp. 24ML]MCX9157004.1 class I poly(R)-hydroxyalkanoic acid synthase [Niveibacterium sp. 24ML]
MTVSNQQPGFDPAVWLKAGQGMMQGMFDFVSRQQEALKQAGIKIAPLDAAAEDTQPLAKLQQELAEQHAKLWAGMLARKPDEAYEPLVALNADRRFSASVWGQSPVFDYMRQAYLINADFLTRAADALPVADRHARSRLQFLVRQYVEAMSPANYAATNPEFIQKAVESKGESITRGILNMVADLEKGRITMTDESAFEVGRNLAVTPGAVVFENELVQLIQYSPQTAKVRQRPLLIVPPCINKYYILDLQPENSFVQYAVSQGMTTFLVSWRNPKDAQGRLTWDDYIEQGVLRAIEAVQDISKCEKPNILGFCVGGTLTASALAVAAARGEVPVESLTLLTTLLDFEEAGDLACFVDEASVATRENTIGKGGLLAGRELSSVFSVLRPNDLIWNYVVDKYLKGNLPPAFDLLYWNSDSTNLPGPFAAWYLRNMYLENNLRTPGRLSMCGEAVDLGRVACPHYIFATREDHIVPWRSSYHGRRLLGGESTFVLGASGHIAGVINPAAKNKRSFWVGDNPTAVAEEWFATASEQRGSWWPHWIEWLKARSGDEVPAPKRAGDRKYKEIEPAPGRYVKEPA